MINAISFGSTYKVGSGRTDKDLAAYNKFEDLCEKYKGKEGVTTVSNERMINISGKKDWSSVQTLKVPDNFDEDIETYCALRGIQYSKTPNDCQCEECDC